MCSLRSLETEERKLLVKLKSTYQNSLSFIIRRIEEIDKNSNNIHTDDICVRDGNAKDGATEDKKEDVDGKND